MVPTAAMSGARNKCARVGEMPWPMNRRNSLQGTVRTSQTKVKQSTGVDCLMVILSLISLGVRVSHYTWMMLWIFKIIIYIEGESCPYEVMI